ncbi:MAG TPA: two-component regulator propeller domain-containing protein [Bacteroidales bacterium]|nr:two-component regulator propeller domain-containing protein [Bacteroidales bacterium]
MPIKQNIKSFLSFFAERFICGVLLLFPFCLSANENLKFERIDDRNELSSDFVSSIIQDNDGYMWFATLDGLNRYDGYTVKVYKNRLNGEAYFKSNVFECIEVAKDGKLWLGTKYFGIQIFDPKTESVTTISNDPTKALYINDNQIQDLLRDSKGRMWIATYHGVARYDPDKKIMKIYAEDKHNPGAVPFGNVTSIYEDSQGRILFGTWENGLYVYNEKTDSFRNYYISQNVFNLTNPVRIWSFLEDKNGYTWIGTWETGLFKVRITDNSIEYLNHFYLDAGNKGKNICDNIIFCLEQTPDNSIWVGTSNGLSIISNPNANDPEIISYNEGVSTTLPSKSEIYEMKQDVSGSMWLATMGGGVNKIDLKRYKFELFNIPSSNTPLTSEVVYCFYPVNENELLLGVRSLVIGLYNLEKKTFKDYRNLPVLNEFTSENNSVFCIFKDSRENLWFGTRYLGLYKKDGKTGKLQNIVSRYFFSQGPPPYSVNCIAEDRYNCLWVGTSEGLIKLVYNHEIDKFDTYKYLPDSRDPNSICGKNITSILIDSQHVLWIATEDGGISRLKSDLKDHASLKFETINDFGLSKLRVSGHTVNVIVEDNKNRIWIGTGTDGIIQYDRKTNSFRNFPKVMEFTGNTVYNLIPDNSNAIWATTNKGLVRLVVENEDLNIQNFTVDDGLQGNIFNLGASYKDNQGRIYIGGLHGFNRFNPEEFQPNLYLPPVVVTKIEINNEPVEAERIQDNRLVLSNQENNFSVSFSALSYSQAKNNKFMHKLEGFDNDWIMSDCNNRTAVYTNVPPGKYTFLVKAANNSWIWNEQPVRLILVVKPSPFLTKVAITIYLLLFLSIIYMIFWFRMNNLKIKQAFEIEKLERVKNENINEFKLRFFTNVSHELLTPLSIISCGVEELNEKPGVDKNTLQSIWMNVNRLITLIKQLLDFRKIESGDMRLDIELTYIDEVFEKLKELFQPLAKRKNMVFTVNGKINKAIYCDVEKIETILTNLVSNAFKYSNEGGCVQVEYSLLKTEGKEFIEIVVKDTGYGISEKEIEHIFDRFYQVSSVTGRTFGVGIGLHLVKNIVDLHQGTITVKSNKEGEGSMFTIRIPLNKNLKEVKDEQTVLPNHPAGEFKVVLDEILVSDDTPESESGLVADSDFSVLVVEDNNELRKLISKHLSRFYKISEARDGIEGYEAACSQHPDLIVSDVMMPGMNGFEMCKKLKADFNVNHIMIILLTAKFTNDDRYEGYLAGADSYIAKPLDLKLLKARIDSLKKQREIIKEKFSGGIGSEFNPGGLSQINVDFMQQIIGLITENIEDPEFNVTMMLEKIHISHSTLYRKIQSLTGMSPNEFIRNVRITEAARLMKNKDISIAEIATMVGFNDHSYFTRCFKKKFNKTPIQFVGEIKT